MFIVIDSVKKIRAKKEAIIGYYHLPKDEKHEAGTLVLFLNNTQLFVDTTPEEIDVLMGEQK